MRFDLAGADDRELPLTLALMPVLSRSHTDAEHFEDQTLAIPVGSGPYRVVEVKPGQRLVLDARPRLLGARPAGHARPLQFRRDPHRLLPRRERDVRGLQGGPLSTSASRTTRRAGFRATISPPRATDAFVKAYGRLRPAQGRRRLRLQHAARRCSPTCACARRWPSMFDFEWINANLLRRRLPALARLLRRQRTLLGRPARRARAERALLAPFPGRGARRRDGGTLAPPVSDGSGRDRAIARRALDELASAGYALTDGALARRQRAARSPSKSSVKTAQEERLALAYSRIARAHRRRSRGATGRRGAVPAPARQVRFRHDDRLVARLALAGRRAARPLGLAVGRRWKAPTISPARASPAIDAMIEALLAAREATRISSPRRARSIGC